MRSLTSKLLALNVCVMLTFVILFLYQTYSKTDESIVRLVNQQAALALQFDLSIRQYVANTIRPSMYALTQEDEFYPETMSTSYIARSIFEDVRKKFPDYIIKFSSDNPRNPLNQAGPEELNIIKMFNEQPQLNQWEGNIVIGNEKYIAKFSARRMIESCIRCHGKPEDAPASLVKRYGDKAGFNRKLGDVLGLDTVAIPMTKVIEQRRSEFLKASLFIGAGVVLLFTAIFLITRYLIINRLSEISNHFLTVSQEKDYRQIEPLKLKGKDEISDLAFSFNTMSERLKASYKCLNDEVNQRTSELKHKIVELKKSESKLRQSEEKFRFAFQTSPNVITLTSVEDGIYVDINDAFTKLLGYTREEVIGKSSLVLNIWADIKDRERLVSGLEQDGIVHSLKAQFKGKEGQIVDGIMSARILDIENKKFLLATTQDITQIKQSEKDRLKLEIQLQQAQKMESIGTLAGGIAHDFNNILFPILGYTEMLLEDASDKSPLQNSLNQIYAGALRAKDLVTQILTFSRQENRELKLLEIEPLVQETLKLVRSTIPTTIKIVYDIEKDCGLIKANPTQIHQIIMNLTTNAYHAMMDSGGELRIGLEKVRSDKSSLINTAITPGCYVCLSVHDSGVGMADDVKDKIFNPFYTTKEKGKGTGMGLSVVHGIVTGLGGAIHVDSVLGKGTQFHVYLPIAETVQVKRSAKLEAQIVGGTEKILLVDDEENLLTMEKTMLEHLGYTVTACNNSIEALSVFRSNPDKFDMVITDMAMPKMPGDALSSELIKIRPDIPVLLCTGFSETISEEKAASMGIKGFLLKPILMKDLDQKIREVLT